MSLRKMKAEKEAARIVFEDRYAQLMLASVGGALASVGKPGARKMGSPASEKTILIIEWLAKNGPANTNVLAETFGKTKDAIRSLLSNYLTSDIVSVVGHDVIKGRSNSCKSRIWQVGPGYDAWAKAEAARNG